MCWIIGGGARSSLRVMLSTAGSLTCGRGVVEGIRWNTEAGGIVVITCGTSDICGICLLAPLSEDEWSCTFLAGNRKLFPETMDPLITGTATSITFGAVVVPGSEKMGMSVTGGGIVASTGWSPRQEGQGGSSSEKKASVVMVSGCAVVVLKML